MAAMSSKYPRLDATRNYVIDLETLALGPDAIVTSAALAQFDSSSTRLIATWTLDVGAQQRDGRRMDADTVLWWMRQSEAARMSVAGEEAQRKKVHPRVFLCELVDWLTPAEPVDTGRLKPWPSPKRDTAFTLWAKPSHFDIAILEHMARQYKVPNHEAALHRRKMHNVRTALAVVNLLRWHDEDGDLDEAPAGVAHDATADVLVTADVMRRALFETALNRSALRDRAEENAMLARVVDDWVGAQ